MLRIMQGQERLIGSGSSGQAKRAVLPFGRAKRPKVDYDKPFLDEPSDQRSITTGSGTAQEPQTLGLGKENIGIMMVFSNLLLKFAAIFCPGSNGTRSFYV